MFRFEDPAYLYLLILIPILIAIRMLGLKKRKQQLKKFGDVQLLQALMPDVSKQGMKPSFG